MPMPLGLARALAELTRRARSTWCGQYGLELAKQIPTRWRLGMSNTI
jgi:hypothetical protein